MKIFIAGSMAFAQQILDTQHLLEKSGHTALIPSDTQACIENPTLNMDANHAFATDIMKDCMDRQEQCEALLVLNYPKDNIHGYIGGHVLIELGLAYYLKQKIFLLYAPPPIEISRYSHEILHMQPVILDGDLEKIGLDTHKKTAGRNQRQLSSW